MLCDQGFHLCATYTTSKQGLLGLTANTAPLTRTKALGSTWSCREERLRTSYLRLL